MRSTLSIVIPFLMLSGGCASTAPAFPEAWFSVPKARVVRSLQLDPGGIVRVAADGAASRLSDGPIQVVRDGGGSRIANGLKLITETYPAIDSLDLSEEREEVAFSALRDGDYDIALVASDGSAMNWMPDDPADEVGVQWAPKGAKISYIIRARGGDVVRTLHIPTAFQYVVPFENATINALAWDAEGAQYAVSYSTPVASDRVEVVAYDGSPRVEVLAPAEKLDVHLEPFAAGAMAMRPEQLVYSEKLPLVIWVDDSPGWNDARAALQREARVAVVMTRTAPTAALWSAIDATPWIDTARVYVVGARQEGRQGTTAIVADGTVAPREVRTDATPEGRVVSVAPAVVQSFAARFIASDLDRTVTSNGIRR